MIHSLFFNWISGMNVGIEVYTGDDLMEGDKFAIKFNLLILSVTYVISELED